MYLKKGVYVALVTPFTKDNEICFNTLQTLVDFHITSGTTGLVLLGTTGEAPALSTEEKCQIVKFVYTIAKKKIDVVVGVGGNNTKEVIDFIYYCNSFADALLATVPNYNRPTQDGIYRHFEEISKKTSLPIMMYNIPSRCGVNMEPETIAKLSKIENIVAIKEASGSISQLQEIKKQCDIMIFSGDDSLILPTIALGGVGVVSVLANILPNIVLELVELSLNNDFDKAGKLYYQYHEKIKTLFIETNPIPIKEAMAQNNMLLNQYRLPMLPSKYSEKINQVFF
jgi:4-hydroxy-tetrahydrodipicolinate synthase